MNYRKSEQSTCSFRPVRANQGKVLTGLISGLLVLLGSQAIFANPVRYFPKAWVFQDVFNGAEQDDLKFAEALAQHGYSDLAAEVCQNVIDTSSDEDVKAQAGLTLARIIRIKVQFERDPEKIKHYMDEAIAGMKQFIKGYPDHPETLQAKFDLGELLQIKGDFLTRWMKIEPDAEKKARLRLEAEAVYAKAGQYFKEMIAAYTKLVRDYNEEIKKEKDPNKKGALIENKEDTEAILVSAKYLYPVTLYSHAMMYEKSEAQRKSLIVEAKEFFENLMLEYPGRGMTYLSAIYAGLCYIDLNDYDNALNYFNVASEGLLEEFRKEPDKKEIVRDIVERAFYHKAQTYYKIGKYNMTIQAVDKLFKAYPNAETKRDEYALQAIMEKAKALFRLDQTQRAFDIINKIIGMGGSLAREAEKIRERFIRDRGLEVIPPEAFLSSIKNLLDRGKCSETIKQCQMFINALRKFPLETQQKYIPKALYMMGQAYIWQKPERIYEALQVYEEIYLKYREVKDKTGEPIAAMAGREASVCYLKIAEETKDKLDEAKSKKIRADIYETWRGSSVAKNVEYYVAQDFEHVGEYFKAAEAYAKILESSPYYVDVKANTPRMYYKYAHQIWKKRKKEKDKEKREQLKQEATRYFNLAEQGFKKFFKYVEENIDDPSVKAEDKDKMRHYQPQCQLLLAQVYLHEAIRKYAEIPILLKGYETKWERDMSPKERNKWLQNVFQSYQYKIEAWLKLADLTKAEANLSALLVWAKQHDFPFPPAPIQLVALGYETEANKLVPAELSSEERARIMNDLRKNKPDAFARFVQSIEKSRKYLILWIENSKRKLNPEQALTVADKLYRAAGELGKVDFYKKAADIYNRILKKVWGRLPRTQEPWGIRWKLSQSYIGLNNWTEALPCLERLEREGPPESLGFIKKELATAYEKIATASRDVKKWILAIRIWIELVQRLPKGTEEYWNARYHIPWCQYNAGAYDEAMSSINSAGLSSKGEFDKNKYGVKDKFIDLKKELEEILPAPSRK